MVPGANYSDGNHIWQQDCAPSGEVVSGKGQGLLALPLAELWLKGATPHEISMTRWKTPSR